MNHAHTDQAKLAQTIDAAFEDAASIGTHTTGEVREAVETALDLLDKGLARVAEKRDGEWVVNAWLKKAVLLSFRLNPMEIIKGGPGDATCGTRFPPSSTAGAGLTSRKPASARFRARSCAARPTSPRASS